MVIFIGGSWGVGEWDYHQLTGPSVVNFFSEQEVTLNLCRSSTGAAAHLDSLTKFLTKYKHDYYDVFYWLVHNPLVDVPVEEIYSGADTLNSGVHNLLVKQLTQANKIANEYDILINLVGASCDLDSIDMSQFNRLLLKVPSWGKLLIPEYPTSIFAHQADHLTDLKLALEQHRPDLLEEYYKIGSMAFKKRRCMQKNENMFQSFHPTSLGHLKLRDYLCSDEAFQLHNNKEIK